jgi:hypothetical protein
MQTRHKEALSSKQEEWQTELEALEEKYAHPDLTPPPSTHACM